MSDPTCWCACHYFDDDGMNRALFIPWRCSECGAEPEIGDRYAGDERDAIRRHVLDNGRVVLLDIAPTAEMAFYPRAQSAKRRAASAATHPTMPAVSINPSDEVHE